MNCLKCGKETQNQQVFCNHCLQGMDAYPVKPGTAVHLPHRPEQPISKKQAHRRKPLNPEDQISHLRKAVRRLVTLAVLMAVLLTVLGAMLVRNLLPEDQLQQPGRNYAINRNNTP
ncbi:MAG: hypothetical protein IJB47_02490 [Oscillospiraceae bacterium]|nr:hypothetical protein [Oscillospiraceae bacterium]